MVADVDVETVSATAAPAAAETPPEVRVS